MNVDWNNCPNTSLLIFIQILCIVIDTWILFSKAMCRFHYFRYMITILLAIVLFLVANIEQHLPTVILDLATHYDMSKLLSLLKVLQAFQLASYISILLFANLILSWDSKVMLAIGLGGLSVCHLLARVTIPLHNVISIINWVLERFFYGMIFPFFLIVMSFWTPLKENATLISISMFGYWLGLALCKKIFLKFTHVVVSFYIFGALGLCWTVLWSRLAKAKPSDEPKITQTEMNYILRNGNEGGITKLTCSIRTRIFYTKSTLSIFLVILCNDFNFTILSLTGLNNVLDNTYLYSYLVAAFVIVTIALISDYFRKYYYTTIIKKMIICIGLFSSAVMITFIGTSYPMNPLSYSALHGSFVVVQAIIQTSCLVNLVEVMHHAAGYALGVYLGLARLIMFLVTFSQTKNSREITCWVVVGLNVVGCVIYAICGSAKREIWVMNNTETTTETSIAVIEIRNESVTHFELSPINA